MEQETAESKVSPLILLEDKSTTTNDLMPDKETQKSMVVDIETQTSMLEFPSAKFAGLMVDPPCAGFTVSTSDSSTSAYGDSILQVNPPDKIEISVKPCVSLELMANISDSNELETKGFQLSIESDESTVCSDSRMSVSSAPGTPRTWAPVSHTIKLTTKSEQG
jgi:hypothetical protein